MLDTSGWLAALNPRESHHPEARRAYEGLLQSRSRLVTTNLIVAEMHILISRARGPEGALEFMDALHADSSHEVVHVDRDLEIDATDRWLRTHRGIKLSLADATAFELSRQRRIRSALTLDPHYRWAGLRLLPEGL